jgi:type I restriction enzyme M protein
MPLDYSELKNRLWHAADELRANSRLRSHQHSVPVLGLIFLRYTDYKFSHAQAKLAAGRSSRGRSVGLADYHARGVFYLCSSPTLRPLSAMNAGAGRLPVGAWRVTHGQ